MAIVRCLQSFYLIEEDQVLNFNDELEIKNEKTVKSLTDKGLVDVLIEEEKPNRKPKPKKEETPKTDGGE